MFDFVFSNFTVLFALFIGVILLSFVWGIVANARRRKQMTGFAEQREWTYRASAPELV